MNMRVLRKKNMICAERPTNVIGLLVMGRDQCPEINALICPRSHREHSKLFLPQHDRSGAYFAALNGSPETFKWKSGLCAHRKSAPILAFKDRRAPLTFGFQGSNEPKAAQD